MDLKHLLFMRYVLLNVVALGVGMAAFFEGWVRLVLEADVTKFCIGISVVFAVGLGLCTFHAFVTSRELSLTNRLADADGDERLRLLTTPAGARTAQYLGRLAGLDPVARSNVGVALRHRLFSRITHIRHIANSLVVLGLIGTVIGFIIALSGVDPTIATDPSTVSPMIATLIEGMSVALYTTLVGAILSVWLGACFQVLATGTSSLFTALLELGEHVEARRD